MPANKHTLTHKHTDSNASALCTPCAAGKYSNSTGASNHSTCVDCPGNASSPVASLTSSACTCNKAATLSLSLSPSLSCLLARRQSCVFGLHVQQGSPSILPLPLSLPFARPRPLHCVYPPVLLSRFCNNRAIRDPVASNAWHVQLENTRMSKGPKHAALALLTARPLLRGPTPAQPVRPMPRSPDDPTIAT
jgi:hypothetical protein